MTFGPKPKNWANKKMNRKEVTHAASCAAGPACLDYHHRGLSNGAVFRPFRSKQKDEKREKKTFPTPVLGCIDAEFAIKTSSSSIFQALRDYRYITTCSTGIIFQIMRIFMMLRFFHRNFVERGDILYKISSTFMSIFNMVFF